MDCSKDYECKQAEPSEFIDGIEFDEIEKFSQTDVIEAISERTVVFEGVPHEQFETDIKKLTRRNAYKNLIILSFSFTLVYTAFNSFGNVQSSINRAEGMGTIGLSIVYCSQMVTSLFFASFTTSRFRYKVIIVVSMVSFLAFLLTGFYSTWGTIVPGSIIVGIGSAHIWPAQQAYITDLAKLYAICSGNSSDSIIALFTGIFYAFFYSSQIWGNLFSSLVFQREISLKNTSETVMCGARFCPLMNNTVIVTRPPQSEINVYTAICVGCTVMGILVMSLFLQDVRFTKKGKKEIVTHIKKVGALFVNSADQRLLIVPSLIGGLSSAIIASDFTLAFVSCPFGVGSVGLMMIAFGVSVAGFSAGFGRLTKYTGHYGLFVVGFVAQMCFAAVTLTWVPSADTYYAVFLVAAIWGVCTAVNMPLVLVLYSVYFEAQDRDTALSGFRMLNGLGLTLAFGYSSRLCMRYKMNINMGVACLSLLCVTILSVKHRHTQKICLCCKGQSK
ncbi:protein unc-93 homolog A-like [Mya arenaria]|uniref:protein unc-93 homolog A-like n=1 Tax=Mya arenaria TaxID=6604 RepID=UPI0022DF80B8|nr:protein unc-93 homolog A-like [Mya arenaria]